MLFEGGRRAQRFGAAFDPVFASAGRKPENDRMVGAIEQSGAGGSGGANSRSGKLGSLSLAVLGLAGAGVWVANSTGADPGPSWQAGADEAWQAGFASIDYAHLRQDVEVLAGPGMEGRDTPGEGLRRAGDYIQSRLTDAGFVGAGDGGDFRIPFDLVARIPVPERCRLELELEGESEEFAFGDDFMPVPGAQGEAEGVPLFLGYGITSRQHRSYDDLKGDVNGRIAVILEGDPNHPTRFAGPELTDEADIYSKLESLARKKLAGVIVVRSDRSGADGDLPLGFRHTWATWIDGRIPRKTTSNVPAIAVDRAAASRLLGVDIDALAEEIDRRGRPLRREYTDRRVRFESASTRTGTTADNIVGVLRGSDGARAGEWIVIGAHYDHVGVDTRGRVGYGADDNASGVAVMLEVAQALALAEPRRSVLACAFASEEDGLLGSQAIAAAPPIDGGALVAMLNLDMVGRGDEAEVSLIGARQNPSLERLVSKARTLGETGIEKVETRGASQLFERSDHYSFHRAGVPALFFFEGLPISRNPDYHTWRDTAEKLNFEKLSRTSKLVYNAAWLLANDDARPPSPR